MHKTIERLKPQGPGEAERLRRQSHESIRGQRHTHTHTHRHTHTHTLKTQGKRECCGTVNVKLTNRQTHTHTHTHTHRHTHTHTLQTHGKRVICGHGNALYIK